MNKFDIKFWWWDNKNEIKAYGFMGFVFVGIGICIFKACTRPEAPIKNETHCAQFIYFNSLKHQIDTTYSPVTMYDDSIVNITTPNGKVWIAKDFLTDEDLMVDEISAHDITTSNGERYKIIPLDSGHCQSKTIMDSMRNTYPGTDESDN